MIGVREHLSGGPRESESDGAAEHHPRRVMVFASTALPVAPLQINGCTLKIPASRAPKLARPVLDGARSPATGEGFGLLSRALLPGEER